jgi:O-antigen/teichoic acid export membrane protein
LTSRLLAGDESRPRPDAAATSPGDPAAPGDSATSVRDVAGQVADVAGQAPDVAGQAPDGPATGNSAGTASAPVPGMGGVAKGFGWTTLVQLTSVGGNLALTPFIIHGLGIERYGLFMLALTFMATFSSLDGGAGGTASRYFAIYAARDDRIATTRLLLTLGVAITGIGLMCSAATWFLAPVISTLLPMSAALRPQAVLLLRIFGLLALSGLLHSLFQQVLNARQRWAWSSQTSLFTYVLYIIGFVIVIRSGAGLEGVAFIFVGNQVLASVLIIPAAVRYLDRRGLNLLTWQEFREVMSFSGKVQVRNIAAVVNNEVDPLVIAGGLSVRSMGIYTPGANFAFQLFTVSMNALGPAGVYLGNIFGREGPEGAFREFVRLQKAWVIAVTGWSAAAMGSVYFGISAWLGPRFDLSGWVCIILTAGNAVLLVAALITTYASVVGRAGLAARYGVVAMVVNLALTVPLVLLGSLGVVAATAAGEVASAAYLIHNARRLVRPDIPNPLRDVPVLRGVATAAVTAAMEFALRPYVPTGPVGLLAMGVPAAIGLLFFAVLMVGPGRVGRSLSRPRQAIARLREQVTASPSRAAAPDGATAPVV